MPREKECKLKKPKNGCLLFYPTIETDNAEEIEYFIIISYAVLRNHARARSCSSCATCLIWSCVHVFMWKKKLKCILRLI